MKQLLILTLLSVIFQFAKAQSSQSHEIGRFIDQFERERSSGSAIDPNKYANVAGSPYMNDLFIEGEVVINDSILFGKVPLRYNIVTDKMEFKNKRDQLMEIDYSAGQFSFVIDKRQFIVMDYKDKNKIQNGHLELLVDGAMQLYKKHNRQFEKATEVKAFEEPLPDRFTENDPTYLMANKGEIPESISGKKDLLQKLNEDAPKVEQYLKDNKLKMRSEESIVDLITFYNNAVLNNQ